MRLLRIAFFLCIAAVLPLEGSAADTDAELDSLLRAAHQFVAREALTPPSAQAVESSVLKGYLHSVDVYSTYLSPEEVRAMAAAKADGFVGVGMDVLQDASGIVYCLPYPESPAEKAGIRHGDILLSVEDTLVSAVPFVLLESMVRGEKDSTVRLGVMGQNNTPRVLSIRRSPVTIPHVTVHRDGPFPRIRIFRFTEDTPGALRNAMFQLRTPERLVLDLRGNPGGDMNAAVTCASLFLDAGNIVSILVNREGQEEVRRAGQAADFRMPVAIWQDRFTASAAEVFIAAITRNGRGKSLGQRSFGKGLSQRAVGSGNGGVFILTTAKLLQPDGEAYHGIGLEPDLIVSRSDNPEHDYFRRTHESFGLRP
ncbi:hypothetical protein LJC23_07805 [Desulfovibrio sp. OttesenSCG-928-I05]|nr:hypothetical protein [Desulfovibrio sp. OttesenSCG-928-I05]